MPSLEDCRGATPWAPYHEERGRTERNRTSPARSPMPAFSKKTFAVVIRFRRETTLRRSQGGEGRLVTEKPNLS
jgi:hypothetical protein